MTHPNSKDGVREEFLSEAQDLIENLSRDLLMLDHAQKEGSPDPDLLNDLFRGVHTVKGLAGMFGYAPIAKLAHHLEDLLDNLRLGRISLSQETLDLLFEGVDAFQRLLAEAKDPKTTAEVDLDRFTRSVSLVTASPPAPANILSDYDLDPNLLAVLTEYEEHRLRATLQQGMTLFRLRVCLLLDEIDSALDGIKTRAKGVAEIITYMPSMGGSDGDQLDIEILLASRLDDVDLREVLELKDAVLQIVDRRRTPSSRSPAATVPATTPPAATTDSGRPAAAASPDEFRSSGSARRDGGELASLRSVTNSVRVDIRKLDHLMNVVGELGIVRGTVVSLTERCRAAPELRSLAGELQRVQRSFERHLNEAQEGILAIRMVPLGHIFDKLARIVRQVARERGKDVRLVVKGSETEVDKLIAEELADPLMHIVRNAVDHGAEPPAIREAAQKTGTATLSIDAFQKGNHVVIEIKDDGAGIDPGVLLQTAVRKGLLNQGAVGELSREELLGVIFMPGFSTAEQVTDISGRGMGMDVVKTNISRLGGVIDVQSELGVGTTFVITLPITLAIISALVVRVAGRAFAVPLSTVQEALRLEAARLRTVERREVYGLRGETLPLCRLAQFFGFAERPAPPKQYVVVVTLAQRRLGFVVDELYGQRDIVIKPLGRSLQNVRGIAGATDLGEQRLALVLDAPALLEELLLGAETGTKRERQSV
ncbi:MAG: chemotaxis protein CheA [Proteobacteria bacterium]|nr:chemotaxis protein CheA [Pseudomonadota bacterium]